MAMIETVNLTRKYGELTALDNLNLTIEQGSCFGFIGPNGAGKTTTIKILATLLKPTWGEARVDGKVVGYQNHLIRPIIGYVPDFMGAYEDMLVSEYLEFFAACYGIHGERRRTVVSEVLELTDLVHKATADVNGLSRGMQQRLSVARVLLHDPKVLLMDEPSSGLDPRARIEMRELLKELQTMGKTIIVSSHILHELAQFCSHIGIVERGQMVANGSLADIYRALSLRRTVHVQLANQTPELAAKIRALPHVAGVDEQPDRLAVQLREDEMSAEDLLDAIHALGARIRMFQPDAMDMETAFMKLTEGKTA
jgi:ABC-2 type transport system ATP-binding protein